MRGLGIEIAKNIILTEPEIVSIFDNNYCSISDLSSNFYISPENINKMRRDEACLTNLIKLNPNVNVNIFQSYEDLKRNIKNMR